MPELPEVETIKRGLEKLIVGHVITDIFADNPKSYPNAVNDTNQFVIGRQVKRVRRRAKVLLIDLDSGYSLLVHLKMTGQLVYDGKVHFGAGHPSASLRSRLPDKTTRVSLTFDNGSRLYFNDQRKFGWMKLYPTSAIDQLEFFKKLGPEPLDQGFSWQDLKTRMQRRSKSMVKPVLMDQSVIAGVGNIYADESLWGAKVHPAKLVGDLTDDEYRKLHRSLREILTLSLSHGGSTDRNFVDAEGRKGNYLAFARVFRRQGQPCPRCHNAIIKTRLAGRGTHFCPYCQRLPQDD